jgi:allantoin racemase
MTGNQPTPVAAVPQVQSGKPIRLLLVNANTDDTITRRLVAEAVRLLPPRSVVTGATARFGPRYIASRAALAVAGHAVLDAFAEADRDVDAVLLACFGDPGLGALRELASVPVVGMAEASCRRAASGHARFSIVTGGVLWPAILDEYVVSLGLGERLASVRAVTPTGAQVALDPEGSREALMQQCVAAAREDGAEAILLGGAGLVGMAPRLAAGLPVPVYDSFEVSLAVAVAEVRARTTGPPSAAAPTASAAATETSGLGARLAALMTGR